MRTCGGLSRTSICRRASGRAGGCAGKDNRTVRLIRRVGAGAFEFVHDQCTPIWRLAGSPRTASPRPSLKRWWPVRRSGHSLTTPAARFGVRRRLLDSDRLIELWVRVEDKEEWDVLRRALKAEAERRGLPAASERTREPSGSAGIIPDLTENSVVDRIEALTNRAGDYVAQQFGRESNWTAINSAVWRSIAERDYHGLTLEDVDDVANIIDLIR